MGYSTADKLYLAFFAMFIPVMAFVDLIPIWPRAIVPAPLRILHEFYLDNFNDQLAIKLPTWFSVLLFFEACYNLPAAIWIFLGIRRGTLPFTQQQEGGKEEGLLMNCVVLHCRGLELMGSHVHVRYAMHAQHCCLHCGDTTGSRHDGFGAEDADVVLCAICYYLWVSFGFYDWGWGSSG